LSPPADDSGAGDGAPFKVVGSERPFEGHVVSVRVDRIADDQGREATREMVEHPGAVAALVIDDHGRVVLVEQWRQAMGRRMLEIVAGKYDRDDESPEQTLRRELAEELGYEGGTLTYLASFATTPGWSNEVVDLYLVEGAHPMPDGERPPPDWEEKGLEAVVLPFDEAVRTAAGSPSGPGIGDGKTLAALGLYQFYRSGVWKPNPAAAPAVRPPPAEGG
jgi:8-oxo-dGTP pyrophosphatase MutT (NUDIX family)